MTWQHLLRQGPVVASFTRLLLGGGTGGPVPGPELERRFGPPPHGLVRDYLDHLGVPGPVSTVPPHMFPRWCFALTGRLVQRLPLPLGRAVNAGCRVEVLGPLPVDEPIVVRGRLERVDEGERRFLVTQSFVVSTPSSPDALRSEVDLLVKRNGRRGPSKRDPERVPESAREVARLCLTPADAVAFAHLTGDVNPLHWWGAYARRAGFPGVILHGFATMARAWVAAEADAQSPVRRWRCRFLAPVGLPSGIGVYRSGAAVFVGGGPGAVAQLAGEAEHVPSCAGCAGS